VGCVSERWGEDILEGMEVEGGGAEREEVVELLYGGGWRASKRAGEGGGEVGREGGGKVRLGRGEEGIGGIGE